MSDSSSSALLTVKPTLPAKTATGIFVVVGFVLLVVAWAVGWILAAATGKAMIGLAGGGALWVLALLGFVNKTRKNMQDARYEFHGNRIVFKMRDKTETMAYGRIGHVLFKGGQTLIFSEGFKGLTPPRRMRVDVPAEPGTPKFHQVIDLIRRGCPQHLFSYENGRVEYSRPLTAIPGVEDRRVSRMRTVAGRPAYNENHILLDDAEVPEYAVLQPYDKDRSYYHPALALIKNDGKERTGRIEDGKVLLGFPGTDVSKGFDLEWAHADIASGGGVHVGHFKIKRKVVSPIDDFELQILGRTLELRGDLFDRHYELTLDGAPIGHMNSRFWSLETANEVVFSTPVDLSVALGLALAMNRGLIDGPGDEERE